MLRRYHRTALTVIERYGGPIYGAFDDGRLTGVAATFGAGLYPPPAWTLAYFVPGFLLAGPGNLIASAQVPAAAVWYVHKAPGADPGVSLSLMLWAGSQLTPVTVPPPAWRDADIPESAEPEAALWT